MILDSTGMKISVTHLDGYFASVYQLNKSQYVKLLGLGLIDFLVTNSKISRILFDMRIVSYHSRFTPSDTSSFPETISLPGLMNISFFMGTQIEILLTLCHIIGMINYKWFSTYEYHFSCKSYDGRNNDFSIFIDF
jgi:hypothetical protein